MLWTVWISPRGEGPTERGNLFPLPCLPHSRHLAPCQPYPARAFMRDTRTLLPAAPTPPAPAALLPRPRRGRGPCPGVYQGSSRARGGAGGKSVSGSFPPIPWHWTVGISPLGVGLTGRGNSFPLPCLPRSQNSEYLTDPVRVPCRWVPKELAGGPHPARACGAPPPPPPGGGVRAWRYLVSSRIRFFSRLSPCTGPWEYRPWGRRPAGRGNLFPLSCLPHSNHLTSRRLHLAGISAGNSPPPPAERDSARASIQ